MTLSRPFALRSTWVSVGLALLLALGLVPAAFANTIPVDANCVDSNMADPICDDNTTYRTIAGAVGATIAGDIINVTTPVSHTEAGLTITHSVTIQGQGQNTTIWQAALAPNIAASRIFTVNPGVVVTVTAITLQYGNFNGAGGAIYNQRGTLTLTSVNVFTNTSTGGGGAIYNQASTGSATLWLTNTVFAGNTTTETVLGIGGGAIWNLASNGTAVTNIASSQFVSNSASSGGGAVYSSNALGTATLRVTDTVFLRNSGLGGSSDAGGGAIRTYSNNGTNNATLENSQFISNTTVGSGGGAVFDSVNTGTSNLAINSSQFYSNTAQDDFYGGGAVFLTNSATTNATITGGAFLTNTTYAGGGAIYNDSSSGTSTLNINGVLFRNNAALDNSAGGGAIYNFGLNGTARVYIESSQFLSNTTMAGGGALNNAVLRPGSSAYMSVISSTLAYNTASGTNDGGGAIYNYAYLQSGSGPVRAQLVLTDTAVYNNKATGSGADGGAVFSGALDTGAFATFTAVNSTFSNNTAAGTAAIYNDISNRDNFTTTITFTASSLVTLTQVTVFSNTAGSGGGALYVDGFDTDEYARTELYNTLISGNSGNECSGAGTIAGTNNFIDDTTCGSASPFRLGSAQGTVLALADNGGPTLTDALSNASPAVDTAEALYCPAADQRGTARPQGATCDVGAWEGVFSAITQFLAVDPPDGAVGQSYAYTLTTDGFPVTITLQAGTLPPGLTLGSGGALTGTPTITGTYGGLVFRATNGLGHVDALTQSITINPGLIVSASPPDGQVGLAYSHTITATGTVVSYTVTGALPPGLNFSVGGVLSGTPTLAGTYTGLVFSARNGATISASSPQTIVITEVVHITADPPDGVLDVAYSYQLGGSGNPITYTLQAGTLPPGLTLDDDGWLHGTPTVPGTYSGLVFRADNGWDIEDTAALEIVITEEFRIYLPLVVAPDNSSRRAR